MATIRELDRAVTYARIPAGESCHVDRTVHWSHSFATLSVMKRLRGKGKPDLRSVPSDIIPWS